MVGFSQAQDSLHKTLPAQRLTGVIKIDGDINDAAWQTAPVAKDFLEWRPSFGQKEAYENRTEVKLLYDNTSIYIAGYCHEKSKDSITKELVGRDVVGINDFVGVIFDTYNDKINGFGFYTTVLGEQFDAKYSDTNGEDGGWSAVWFCETKLLNDGWTFEMRIPYSALRFSKNTHTWGLNITRKRCKSGKQFMWNPVSPTIQGFLNQSGIWTGLSNIEPPLRLSFTPYLSTYLNHYPYKRSGETKENDFSTSVNGGLDVKYGINQNYTLDMTLIPDFGQVQSDKQVLNLTPFEVQYQENRPFFTEGMEFFNKGDLFYSRRIGGMPIRAYRPELRANEQLVKTPTESKLINATKVSGRNQKGLGIGFFNAITAPMYATVVDTLTGIERKAEVGSLTNYNIVVADQTLKNNSSVSLINTSVLRSGADRDANVTAGVFNFNNKANTYNYYGKVAVSNRFTQEKTTTGYSHNIGFRKGGGRLMFNLSQEIVNDKYFINDMGIMNYNDYIDHYLWVGYKWIKPTKWYNRVQINLNNTYSRRYSKADYQGYYTNINGNIQFKNLYFAGFMINYSPEGNDFYESRSGAKFITPRRFGQQLWLSSNDAKKYYFDFALNNYSRFLKTTFGDIKGHSYFFNFSQRYKFSDRLSVNTGFSFNPVKNDVGYAGGGLFARRDRNTDEATLGIKYNLSPSIGATIVARHYWSQVVNKEYYHLREDGRLFGSNNLVNDGYSFNLFNMDMLCFWQFAPGSFINLSWKNAINHDNDAINKNYIYNLGKTMSSYQNNNFSIKVIYYIDYLDLKKRFGRKG